MSGAQAGTLLNWVLDPEVKGAPQVRAVLGCLEFRRYSRLRVTARRRGIPRCGGLLVSRSVAARSSFDLRAAPSAQDDT